MELISKIMLKLEDTNCIGTKSLPVVINKKKKKNKGVLPECHVVYIDTRTRKSEIIVNNKAADVIDEIKKHVSEGETSQASQSKQYFTFWKDDLLAKVQGPENEKRGCVFYGSITCIFLDFHDSVCL